MITLTHLNTVQPLFAQTVLGPDGSGMYGLLSAAIALGLVLFLLLALHWVSQIVRALVAGPSQMGPVVILVFVFFGLFAAALVLNGPNG